MSEISANQFDSLIGRTAKVDISGEEALLWEQFESYEDELR